jgi:DNA-binding response OmpR family regulator
MKRRKKKIMLIDESVAGLLVGKMILACESYDVVTARSRREGIEKLSSERPDLIVMSAFAGARRGVRSTPCDDVRLHEATRTTPIVLLTARVRSLQEAHGDCDYIAKPVNGLELLAKVRSRLRDGQDRGGEG